MSSCLIDYLRHNKNLPEMDEVYPFCEFDAAVFSWLVYFPLTYVPKLDISTEQITLKKYCEWTLKACGFPSHLSLPAVKNEDDNFTLSIYADEFENELKFLKYIKNNSRYSKVMLERSSAVNSKFESNVSPKNCAQFGAVTFVLPYQDKKKDIRVITFRGTNGTLVGWKENFYFALNKDTQEVKRKAVNYLGKCIEQCQSSRFVITGHSKGGHLAVYSFYKYIGMKWFNLMWKFEDVDSVLKDKLYTTKKGGSVLNFDGPGIMEEEKREIIESITDERFKLENYEHMVTVYAPSSAVVSVLLGKSCEKENFFFVSSNANGVQQHSLCSWIVTDEYDFLRSGKKDVFFKGYRDKFSEFIEETAKEVLSKYSGAEEQEKYKKFIDFVFMILDDGETQMLNQPQLGRLLSYIKKYLSISEKDKVIFKEVLSSILKVVEEKRKILEGEREHEAISRYVVVAKIANFILKIL